MVRINAVPILVLLTDFASLYSGVHKMGRLSITSVVP